MKKILSLGLLAALSLTLLVGCGGEPKDHIWEATSDIKKSKSFDEAMIQIDGVVFPDVEAKEMTFAEIRDYFDQEQYSIIYNDHGKEIEMNTDEDSWEYKGNQVFDFSRYECKIYNNHIDGENNYVGILSLKGKGQYVVVTECPAYFKKFNDEYKGGIYLAGGVPASKGAVKKTDAAKYDDAAKYFEKIGIQKAEDIDEDAIFKGGIIKVYEAKGDNKYIISVVDLDKAEGSGYRAAEVIYKYDDGQLDEVDLDLDEKYKFN